MTHCLKMNFRDAFNRGYALDKELSKTFISSKNKRNIREAENWGQIIIIIIII